MKKRQIVTQWAREAGVSQGEAADRLDRAVGQILEQLRKQRQAPLPGLGKLRLGAGGKLSFEREEGTGDD